MVSNEAFIPHQTKVDTRVPTYVGNLSIEDGNDVANIGLIDTSSRHMLFFGCCDFRRATLVMNTISIFFNIITMILIFIMVGYVKEQNDDYIQRATDSPFTGRNITIMEFILEISVGISIILHACGIYGALYFKLWGINVAGAAYALSFLLSLVSLNIFQALFAALFLYPHYFMYKLMQDGIMTEDNYHKIENCCGVRKV